MQDRPVSTAPRESKVNSARSTLRTPQYFKNRPTRTSRCLRSRPRSRVCLPQNSCSWKTPWTYFVRRIVDFNRPSWAYAARISTPHSSWRRGRSTSSGRRPSPQRMVEGLHLHSLVQTPGRWKRAYEGRQSYPTPGMPGISHEKDLVRGSQRSRSPSSTGHVVHRHVHQVHIANRPRGRARSVFPRPQY